MEKKKRKRKPTLNTAKKCLASAILLEDDLNYKDMRQLFIDRFTLCDLVCKTVLEGYQKYKGIYKPGSYVRLSMKQIPAAVELYGLDIQRNVLNGVFGSSGQYKKRGSKSAKKLRDGIVHSMNTNDVIEVVNRYDSLLLLMDSFLSYFK